MKILNIKSWLQRKKEAKFEFIGNHKIRRIADGREFKLRFMYDSYTPLINLCITYAYTDLIHVDITDSRDSSSIKVHIDDVDVIVFVNKEKLRVRKYYEG